MIMGRTHIKFLRRLGVALILSPEFITTPFGVALVLIARYLAKKHAASLNNRLREMVEYYLAHTGRFGDDADSQSSVLGSVTRYTLSEERAILGQITGSRGFEANLAPLVLQNWHDMRGRTVHHTMDMQSFSGHYKAGNSFKVESGWSNTSSKAGKVIHHTINREWLSQCYEGASAVAHSSWAQTSGAGERVTHHSINMSLLSQHYNTGSVGQVKIKHHNINMSLLRQRYGSAVSYTKVLHARRNNNYYYDIVSRGNVIGGY
jgi:hypothetical protein